MTTTVLTPTPKDTQSSGLFGAPHSQERPATSSDSRSTTAFLGLTPAFLRTSPPMPPALRASLAKTSKSQALSTPLPRPQAEHPVWNAEHPSC